MSSKFSILTKLSEELGVPADCWKEGFTWFNSTGYVLRRNLAVPGDVAIIEISDEYSSIVVLSSNVPVAASILDHTGNPYRVPVLVASSKARIEHLDAIGADKLADDHPIAFMPEFSHADAFKVMEDFAGAHWMSVSTAYKRAIDGQQADCIRIAGELMRNIRRLPKYKHDHNAYLEAVRLIVDTVFNSE